MKKDIFNHKERYLNWKSKIESSDIKEVSKENSDLIKRYIFDMENGLNVSVKSVKSARSYIRLNNLKQRLVFITRELKNRIKVNYLGDLTEEHVFKLFSEMKNGSMLGTKL